LAILKQNETYILCFLVLPSLLSKNRFRVTEGADIYRRCKQIQHLKNWNIAHNIMCFIMNVTIANRYSQPILFTFFWKFSYRQNMFWSRNL